jgi:tetratricopeptide (TPR) repeat protein
MDLQPGSASALRTTSAGALRAAELLAAAAAFLAVILLGLRTVATSEVWMHLASGREIVASGIPRADPFSFASPPGVAWVNTTWLYDVVLWGLWRAGGPALATILHAVAAAAAFLLMAAAAGRRESLPGIGLAVLVCGWVLAPQFAVSPAVAALPFPALFFLLLSRGWRAWRGGLALVPLQVLWANMHPSFPLGPMMAALFAFQSYREGLAASPGEDTSSRARSLAILAVLLAAVCLINPYGVALLRKAFRLWTDPSASLLVEWISPFSADFSAAPTKAATALLLVAAAAGFVLYGGTLPLAAGAMAGAAAFALIRSPRYSAFAAVLIFPFLCLSCRGWGRAIAARPFLRAWSHGGGRLAASGMILILSAVSVVAVAGNGYYARTGSAARCGLGVQRDLFPSQAVLALLTGPRSPERVLNLASDGGYLAWALPGRKVFIDPRLDLYGTAAFERLAGAICGNKKEWDALVSRWEPDAILLNCCWPAAGVAARHVMAQPDWALVYFDGTSAVFLRRQSRFLPTIEDRELQNAGVRMLEETQKQFGGRIGAMPGPPIPPSLIGAANVFLGIGRFSEAESILHTLIRGVPGLRTGPLHLGIALVELDRPAEALPHLMEASRRLPRNPLAWLWLAQALEESGRADESQVAFAKAEALDAAVARAFQRALRNPDRDPATTQGTQERAGFP